MLSYHKKVNPDRISVHFEIRRKVLISMLMLGMVGLVVRAVYLQVLDKQFLMDQGRSRHVAKIDVAAYRGKILDRNGLPLAISTPVESIWVNPKQFVQHREQFKQLHVMAGWLGVPEKKIRRLIKSASHRQFVYLKRLVRPDIAQRIKDLHLSGVYFDREFKRFYPNGEVTAHLLGFTNIDDIGQEGLELNYEMLLHGLPGKKRVIRDGKRRIIENVESIKEPVSGHDLKLSIDQRLQYIAYRELKASVRENKAHAASVVILDAKTGNVLAAVNQPSFNPNTRKNLTGERYRNRTMTDIFEPGSTVKPFVLACALENKIISPNFEIDTSPGWYGVGRNLVKDHHNYGVMDLTRILKKSSNVAVSKIALMMQPEMLWQCYNQLGFGVSAGVGFPGEATGNLLDFQRWHKFEQATLSFGYGLNVSVLQLARAYTALADEGKLHSVSLIQRDIDDEAQQVMSPKTARSIRRMLESVVSKEGTAYRARVEGYHVAGKTGTVKKAGAGGYTKDSYMAVFVGMAPARDPELVIAVMVDEPGAGKYYGGSVAGPVFSGIMQDALRVLGVAPDNLENMPLIVRNEQPARL